MWIVAIGWMYVVTLMAATEPTVVGGIMTFFGVGVFPLSIVFYLAGARRRSARRALVPAAGGTPDATGAPGVSDTPATDGSAAQGADGGHAAGDGGACPTATRS